MNMGKDATTTTGIFLTLDIAMLERIDQAAKFYNVKRNEIIRRWISDGIQIFIGKQGVSQ